MTLPRAFSWLVPIILVVGTLTCGKDPADPRANPTAVQGVGGDGQTAAVGAPLPVPLSVEVTDADGRPVAGVVVAWEASGGGSISNASTETDNNGRAVVQRTLGTTVGAQTTVATVSGLAGSPVTFSATATPSGSDAMGLLVHPPVSVLDDEVFAPDEQPAVKLLDATGAPMAGEVVTASIATGGGTLLGVKTATTNAEGIARFGDLGIDGTGAKQLAFESGALSVRSPSIQVAALSSEATTGKWHPRVDWPIVPLHMHLLTTGKILAWGRTGQPWVWTPPADGSPAGAGSFTEVPADTMLFCAGHAFMPDGRLMVSGGHLRDDRGLQVTYFFTANGNAGTWDNANGALMAKGRWYPTVTILPNGRALTMAGRDTMNTVVEIPEIWDGDEWVALTGASIRFPYYPRNFVAPNGRVFYAGEHIRTRWLDVAGAGQWTNGPLHKWPYNRDYGSAVMYDNGKVMYVGGGGDPTSNFPADPTSSVPTSSAEIIDLNAGSPTWNYTDSMAFRRRHHNAVILPDGQVLVNAGVSSGGELNNLSDPVYAAELWNPATGNWRTLASASVPRGYHSVSLLMPNGLVLLGASGDGNWLNGTPFPMQKNHEMFSPPYLFKGNRPTITTAPSSIGYGQTFAVQTSYTAQITKVTWIRLPSVTHAFDANQRLNTLNFTRTSTGVNVQAPASGNHAPPGHYLLFLMNRNGVPSVGHLIHID